jgi:excisionase family DNA binding protein
LDIDSIDGAPRLYHVEEAARLLSIGRTKAYELIANGTLHAIHLGRSTRISGREIDRFIRSIDRRESTHETAGNAVALRGLRG